MASQVPEFLSLSLFRERVRVRVAVKRVPSLISFTLIFSPLEEKRRSMWLLNGFPCSW